MTTAPDSMPSRPPGRCDGRSSAHLPRRVTALAVVYLAASLLHFVHNAEYIAAYPNMPAWITRAGVYQAWLAVTAVGAVGAALALAGWRTAAAACLAAWGALGLDGLLHYTLALCSQHTLAMNATIWFEVVAGSLLALACLHFIHHRARRRRLRRTQA